MAYGFYAATAVLLLNASPASPAPAATTCRPQDAASAALLRWVKRTAAGTDPAAVKTRDILKIPPLDSTNVRYVLKERTCRRALGPYNAVSGMRDAGTDKTVEPSGALYVV